MNVFFHEAVYRLKYVILTYLIIQLYVIVFLEDLYTFTHQYIFLNRTSFHIEYYTTKNVIDFITSYIDYELQYELYIDYHLCNTLDTFSWYQIFIAYIIIFTCIIGWYESFMYWKSSNHKHELWNYYIGIFIFFFFISIDTIIIKFLWINELKSESSILYQSIEYFDISRQSNIFVLNLVFPIATTFLYIVFINNNQFKIQQLLIACLIFASLYTNTLTLSICILFKYAIYIEIRNLMFIYNSYITEAFKKNKKGNCTGI